MTLKEAYARKSIDVAMREARRLLDLADQADCDRRDALMFETKALTGHRIAVLIANAFGIPFSVSEWKEEQVT